MSERTDQNLSILTKRQRQVYLLRQQKLTFAQIGEQLGISAASAGTTYHAAHRRLRDAAILHDAPSEHDTRPVDFPLTRASWKPSRAHCSCCSARCAAKRACPPRRTIPFRPGSTACPPFCTAPSARSNSPNPPRRRTNRRNNASLSAFSCKKPCFSFAFVIQYNPEKC